MITFRYNLNKPLEITDVPNSATTLVFSPEFNLCVEPNTIPSTIQRVVFGRDFNQKIPHGVIPNSVTDLDLGWTFNQILEADSIPASVQYLSLSWNYNQPLVNVIPPSVKLISFGPWFNNDLNIDLDTKIDCTQRNYDFFAKMKFRHISFFVFTPAILISLLEDNNITDNYDVVTKDNKFGLDTKTTLKRRCPQIKSSRKV